ncbi:hypothetical protein SKAU_G00242310 [Synaphobranchus kaupii]|uniref:Ras-associated and pleckstrin homology domains-containing protein 1 n=1 Tax=Synaphobranchus kaupii TaxID=118154 RepID=A0A9Q1F812_SYNKA|nr:hypothetical protein SKAU_G00242310 [Synaphobranchus kaupii]
MLRCSFFPSLAPGLGLNGRCCALAPAEFASRHVSRSPDALFGDEPWSRWNVVCGDPVRVWSPPDSALNCCLAIMVSGLLSAVCRACDLHTCLLALNSGGARTKPKMEQLSDEELDHAAEEDSDKEDQDLDKMFGAWLGELDKLTQSLDDGKPEKVQKAPLRQETNLANFSYRFSMYNINEALNQGDTVDLDALMADLCSIEQELSSISKPNSGGTSRLGVPGESKLRQKPPAGRSGSAKHGGGGGQQRGQQQQQRPGVALLHSAGRRQRPRPPAGLQLLPG